MKRPETIWIFISFLFPICGLGLIVLVAFWVNASFPSSDESEFATQSVQSFTKSFPDCGFSITSPCELQDVSQHSSGDFLVNLGGVTDGNNRAKMTAYQLIVTKLPVDCRDAQSVEKVLTKACERFYGVKKVRVGRGRFPGYVGYAKHQGMVQKGLICAVNQYAVSLSVMTNDDLETKFIEFSNGFEITAENKMTAKTVKTVKSVKPSRTNTILDKQFSNKYFSIGYPVSWQIVQEENQVTNRTAISLQIMEKRKNEYDFCANINIIVSQKKWSESTANLIKQAAHQYASAIPTYRQLLLTHNISLGKCKGSLLRYSYFLQGFDLSVDQYVVKKADNTAFVVTVTVESSKYNSQKALIQEILKSLIIN